MGSGYDNGPERPTGGGRDDGLPGLPPEWGTVVIPDDLAELSGESDDVRRQLRRARRRLLRRARWRRLTGRPIDASALSLTAAESETPTLALPLMIMAIAVVASLVSLFALSRPAGQSLFPPGLSTVVPSSNGPAGPTALPDLVLIDSHGSKVPLATLHPAVLVLGERCECTGLLADLYAALDRRVQLLLIRLVPADIQAPARVLADPGGALRAAFAAGKAANGASLAATAPSAGASVLLVDATGKVIAVHQQVTDVNELRAELGRLAS